jgi:glutamate racemase
MSVHAPIGIFDSGLGGLSVAREIRRRLPAEDVLYVADTAFCPYGGRPLEEIRERSLAIGRFLVAQGAEAIVVACNTASGAALEVLRAELAVPIVGMEPAVKPAAAATRNGRVGVMATEATLRTDRFERLMHEHASGVVVVSQACPGLVELVEEGAVEGDRARRAVEAAVAPLRAADVDTVVLGCTHYPFPTHLVSEVLGSSVIVIDSGEAVARQVERVLGRPPRADTDGAFRLFTTGDPQRVAPTAERLWGGPVDVEKAAV